LNAAKRASRADTKAFRDKKYGKAPQIAENRI